MTRRWPYVAGAAGTLVLVLTAGWLAIPRSAGIDDTWEAPAFTGVVMGGRALVATDDQDTRALDLVSGTTITLGSVTGGVRSIGGDRLLVATNDTVEAARLDATQRWTWKAPSGTTATTLLATSRSATVALTCAHPTTASSCTLHGIGPGGTTSWTMPMPSGVADQQYTVRMAGLPEVAVLPYGAGTYLLIDPMTSRTVLRTATEAWTTVDGDIVLQTIVSPGRCRVTTGRALDRLQVTEGAVCRTEDEVPGLRPRERVTTRTAHVLGLPFLPRRILEVTGERSFRVVSWHELALLRVDDKGVTLRDGDRVVRYALT